MPLSPEVGQGRAAPVAETGPVSEAQAVASASGGEAADLVARQAPRPARRSAIFESLAQPAEAAPGVDAGAETVAETGTSGTSGSGWQAAAALGPRPKARPSGLSFGDVVKVAASVAMPGTLLQHHLRPMPRPKGFGGGERQSARSALPRRAPAQPEPQVQQAAAIRAAPGGTRMTTPRGSVCGIPGLKGEIISPILGRVQGCGVANPVRITEVDGIRLSQPATIDCETASALHRWVKAGLKPAMGAAGGGVTTMQVAGHYVCRPRNHRKGAKISEHGRGRAIDISGLVLANGQKLSILRDWRGAHGARLKAAHRAACGIFGTTLGPGSDGMHEDHLHFDTARHRNGSYCR